MPEPDPPPIPLLTDEEKFVEGDKALFASIPRVFSNQDALGRVLVGDNGLNPPGFDDAFDRLVNVVNAANVNPPSNYNQATARLVALNTRLVDRIAYIQKRFAYYYSIEGKVPGLILKLDKARALFEAAILKMSQIGKSPEGEEKFLATLKVLERVAQMIDNIEHQHLWGSEQRPPSPEYPESSDDYNDGGGASGYSGRGGDGGREVFPLALTNSLSDINASSSVNQRTGGPNRQVENAVNKVKQKLETKLSASQFKRNVSHNREKSGTGGRYGSGGRKRKSKRVSKRKRSKTKTKKSRKGSRKQRGGFRYVPKQKPKTKKQSSSSSSSSTMSSSARN